MQVMYVIGGADSAKRGGVMRPRHVRGGLRAETDNLFASAERNLLVLRIHQTSGRFTLRRCIALQSAAQHGCGLRLQDFADLGAANMNRHLPASCGATAADPVTNHARAVSGDLSTLAAESVTITPFAASVPSYQFPEFQK